MRSLEEREAQRAEQRNNEKKEREVIGAQNAGGDKWEQNEADQGKHFDNTAGVGGGKGPQEAAFNSDDWVNDTLENIKSELKDLSDKELSAVQQSEKAGKNRTSVNDAIATEKKRREAAGSNWGNNK